MRLTSAEYEYGMFRYAGTMENDGTESVFSPSIRVQVYAIDGTLLGQDVAWPVGQLFSSMLPGTKAGFRGAVFLTSEPDNIRYSVQISGPKHYTFVGEQGKRTEH